MVRGRRGRVKNGTMSANGTIADMLTALTNVRFQGKSGHDANVSLCPLMTHSGHLRCAIAFGCLTRLAQDSG